MTAVIWFRRDLRVHDNPALRAALDAGDKVVPFFCVDSALVGGRHASGPRTRFMLECLAELDDALKDLGSGLVVRIGTPEQELLSVCEEVGASSVHFAADASQFARGRDKRVYHALEEAGIEPVMHPGTFAIDNLRAVEKGGGGPYTVFTPFYKQWLQQPRRELAATPRSLPALPSKLRKGSLPSLSDLKLPEDECPEAAPGGESAARERMNEWCRDGIDRYADEHNDLPGRSVSRLSPYLHFGCVSPRELEEKLPGGEGAQEYRRQIAWRDFYGYILRWFPKNTRSEYQERYRGSITWSRSEEDFDAWREGRTGYPVVDAAMRQLTAEGWMHNRARLIVGSFLTKDLGVDWRRGEAHFMRLLLDGDQASNNGNWQWIASVGVDPAPVSRRLFNPTLQMEKFDPTGEYTRRYVPELRDVPDKYLREPWTMPSGVQEQCGCVIGEDYPAPVVDHKVARREALERYGSAGN